jgi:hypothetical protein
MKHSTIILTVIVSLTVFTNCNNRTEKFLITDRISITLPEDLKILKSDNSDMILEATYNEDLINVFKVPINLTDSLSTDLRKLAFVKNINGFIKPFNFKNLDTTFLYQSGLMQNDIRFEFESHGNQKELFGRFYATDKDFIAICYLMPFPGDKKNLKFKDKFFSLIKLE